MLKSGFSLYVIRLTLHDTYRIARFLHEAEFNPVRCQKFPCNIAEQGMSLQLIKWKLDQMASKLFFSEIAEVV